MIFFSLFASLFLAISYTAMTNMSGLYIVSDLGGPKEISIYGMVFFGLGSLFSIPITESVANYFGGMRLFVYALLLAAFFSFLCGVASTYTLFNIYRIGMGFSFGFFFVLSRRLMLLFAAKEKLDNYTFITQLLYAICPVVGACIGAFFSYESLWRLIFYSGSAVCLLLGSYVWCSFRHLDPPSSEGPIIQDKVGFFFFIIGTSCLTTALALSQQLDWYRSTTFLWLLVCGIPTLLFSVLWTFFQKRPFLKWSLFQHPPLLCTYLCATLFFSAYFGIIILIPLWLNLYTNYTVLWIAALVGIMAVAGLIAYFIFRGLVKAKVNPYLIMAIASILFALSCYYSTFFNPDVDFLHLLIARFLSGLGIVFFFLPLIHLLTQGDEKERSSDTMTLLQVIRMSSSSLGAALYVILWIRRQSFFHERLGEGLNATSILTKDFFQRAQTEFHLTASQSVEQLNILLDREATSLALNDALCFMGYMSLCTLPLILISAYLRRKKSDLAS